MDDDAADDALLPGRLVRALGRRPVLLDVGLVVAVTGMGTSPDVDRPPWTWVLMSAAVALPLLLRRSHPLGVFVAVCVLTLVQAAVGGTEPSPAVLVALYALAAYDGRRRVVLAAVGCLEVAVIATVLTIDTDRVFLALLLITGTVTAAVALGTNARISRAYLASVVERAARLEVERDQQGALAAAAERARIARELHDVVAHSLTVVISLTDGAAYAPGTPEPVRRAVEQASDSGRQALAEMRRLLGVLRSDDPVAREPQPGLAELEALVQSARATGLAVDLVLTGTARQLPASAGLTAYRIVQEALTNVRKHAVGARTATVRVALEDGAVRVEVTDDGHGRARPQVPGDGHGLLGMRERVSLFGGTVTAGPRDGGGWRVLARWEVDGGERGSAATRPAPVSGVVP